MENLEVLTDDQLRSRLVQYGFSNLPVTDTTRKILLKKLRLAMNGQKSKSRRETVAGSKFSSDEELEKETSTKLKRKNILNRRATTTAGNNKIISTNEKASDASVLAETPSAYFAKDSDDDSIEVPVTRRSRTPSLGKSETVRTSYKTNLKLLGEITGVGDQKEIPPPLLQQTTLGRKKTFTTGFQTLKMQEKLTPSTLEKVSLSTSYNPCGNYEDDAKEPLLLNEANTPYLSNFAKRLSTLRAETLETGLNKYESLRDSSSSKSIYKQPSYGHKSSNNILAPASRTRGIFADLAQIFDSLDRQYNFRTTLYFIFIIMIIVAIYVIFI